VSIDLPAGDIEFLDAYARDRGLGSRSAAVHTAVRPLREPASDEAYQAAWDEWPSGDDRALWEATAGDGLP
jgi:hypothetical protein